MPFADDLAVAQHHHVMDIHIGQCSQLVVESLQQPAVHTLGLSRGTGQGAHLSHSSQARTQHQADD